MRIALEVKINTIANHVLVGCLIKTHQTPARELEVYTPLDVEKSEDFFGVFHLQNSSEMLV